MLASAKRGIQIYRTRDFKIAAVFQAGYISSIVGTSSAAIDIVPVEAAAGSQIERRLKYSTAAT